jgi:lipoprotein-anchoring transpeptidase ErfK/SrfK
VMLDRAGFSPGEIDGTMGLSTRRALDAYTKNGGNPETLPSDALTAYQITQPDAAGPFTREIPSVLMQQAKLDALNYRDIVEALSERFHVNPALLRRLNAGATFAAGTTITVPNVLGVATPVGPPPGRQTDEGNPADTTVTVAKSTSDLVVTDAAGHTLFYAPVTTGSEHDPLPIGEWKVTGVQHNPKFHYNPQLFWDAKPGDAKATIAPGPNNPVGVVWIDLSKPDYGIHGTPEPSRIGKTTSHGCVRLTNWDAMKVASLVRPGTRVIFKE